ncbi:hypothetical protein pdam_00012500, partial [Pocillopora damicornis]
DGAEVKFQPCSVGTRNAGGALQLGGGERTENVEITGFNLWNRILTESEIAEEANKCDGGMGGPIVKWREFYKRSLRRNFIRELSQCVVSGAVDGGYTGWSVVSECTATCGGGTKTLVRTCNNPPPARGGKNCKHLGATRKTQECNTQPCPRPLSPSFDVRIVYGGIERNQLKIRPDDVSPDVTQLTMCMWLKLQTTGDWKNDINNMDLAAYRTYSRDVIYVKLYGERKGGMRFYTKGTVKELDDHHWHHVCMAWDGNARTIKYFKDGNSIPSDDDCQAQDKLKGNPKYLTVGYSRRKLGDEVRLTGFNLWDRVLTNKEVLDNARDGAEVKFQPCSVGTRNAGGALQIGGGGRTENVGITGFNLWNRILTESEIVEEANTCDGGMGGPTVKWREFYKKSLRKNFIRELSQCVVSGAIDGGYTGWSAVSQCSVTCGGGIKALARTCKNPPPARGGKDCKHLGAARNTQECNTQPCRTFELL